MNIDAETIYYMTCRDVLADFAVTKEEEELLARLRKILELDDEAAKDAAWNAFRVHPDWKKMSSDPYYKDTVSHITNLVLKPTKASQI